MNGCENWFWLQVPFGVGAVRETRRDEFVVNIQNAGDLVLPLSAVRDVHSGKVVLDLQRLEPDVVEALRHVHDAELPDFAVLAEAEDSERDTSATCNCLPSPCDIT